MKNILFVFVCILQFAVVGYTQENHAQSSSLGSVQHLLTQLSKSTTTMQLAIADGSKIDVNIKYQRRQQNELHLQGDIQGVTGGSFNIDIKAGKVEGKIFMPKAYKAYVYASDADGNATVSEADIRKLVCVDFPVEEDGTNGAAQKPTTDPEVSNLQSNPGAGGCLLVDFDGYEMPAGNYWNYGNAISAAASGMTNEEILKAWEIVSQDYFPFNLNVTTNETVFNSYPQNKRSRCVVTPTNYFFPGCAGISFTGSFLFNNEAPCWVFISGTGLTGKRVGEASSHELGHSLGLSHDAVTGADYYGGHGNWAPIMGNSMSKQVSQWSKGEYAGATNFEDDIAVIANMFTNGVGYRADDHSNTIASATAIVLSGNTLTSGMNKGFIGRTDDLDAFTFNSTGGSTALTVKATSAFTDARLSITLLNSTGTVINTYIANALDLAAPIVINQTLPSGTYYLVINGEAYGTASADYNDYSSLGTYEILGTINNVPLPVAISPLNGKIIDEHNTELSWNTFREENNKGFKMERSADGKNFSEIAFVSPQTVDGNSTEESAYHFTDTKSLAGTSYYRLMQMDVDGKTTYSNIVSIARTNGNNISLNAYPNPAKSQLTVEFKGTLKESASIMLTDMSGRVVLNQPVNTQKVTIDMNTLHAGMYLLKYSDTENTIVHKVMKN